VSNSVAIICKNACLSATAKALAAKLKLPLTESLQAYDYGLLISEQGIALQANKLGIKKPLYLDFADGQHAYRRLHGGGKQQALAKAIGIKNLQQPLTVIDATAGFASDSFVLASLGCTVYAIERSAIIHTLLEDALQRAKANPMIAEIAKRIHLYHGDAASIIPQLPKADAIYLDPMFPHTDNSAQVKKEMQIIRALVGEDVDNDHLLSTAIEHSKRVVVKRPRIAPPLNQLAPSYQLIGQSNRFDVYLK
jgi:16S rRNA (guanine1516-N2)-methyltransferase